MGKYTKRPDGLYQVQINLGRRADGKYQRKTLYAPTIRELEDKLYAYREDISQGVMPNAGKQTFQELAAIWVDKFTPNVSQQGRRQYAALFANHINPAFGYMCLSEIKKADLQSLLNQKAAAGCSRSQLKKIKMVSASVMELAADNGVIPRNVFASVNIPNAEVKERSPLSDHQLYLVLSTWQGHRMGIPVLLMLFCGLRRGELIALTWNDIDLLARKISINKAAAFETGHKATIKNTKTKAGIRTVEIPNFLYDILAQQPRTSVHVCPAANGQIMTMSAFSRAWDSYMRYLNLQAGGKDATRRTPRVIAMQPFTPHQLRHTYATLLYSAGVDMLSAQKLMGHSNIRTTMGIYTHLQEQKRAHSIQALNRYISDTF